MAKIGKNVLENLTSGMYEESKIVYREYIQNAADSIDKAFEAKIFDEKLFIDIEIDESNRNIKIKDNAKGIPKNLVKEKLEDVADSDKVVGEDKGFRGIGRLGGLAYCRQLRFITTSKGEKQKTIMTWDAQKLLDMIADPKVKDDAGSILDQIITYQYEACPEEDHYFIVELNGIRKENNELLDIAKVRKYIQINTPVPYGNKLIYRSKIKEYLEKNNQSLSEYTIYVNAEDIKKPYTTVLFEKVGNDKKKYDEVYDIKIEEFRRDNGELLAWMWYGISSFVKRIPSSVNEMAGIRLRQSNIQIGDENTLVPLFKQDRGNFYFIGEIHSVHKALIPNARRDYFNENEIRNELEAQLTYYFTKFNKLYNDANDAKIAYNKDIKLKVKQQEYDSKNGKFVNDKVKQKLESQIEEAKEDKEKADKKIARLEEKSQDDEVLQIVLTHIKENYSIELSDKGLDKTSHEANRKEPKEEKKEESGSHKKRGSYLVDELSNLNLGQRKLVSKIYTVITNNLPEKESMSLINKIQEELKR